MIVKIFLLAAALSIWVKMVLWIRGEEKKNNLQNPKNLLCHHRYNCGNRDSVDCNPLGPGKTCKFYKPIKKHSNLKDMKAIQNIQCSHWFNCGLKDRIEYKQVCPTKRCPYFKQKGGVQK